jgi:type I restriction enzyme M protein
MFVQSLKFVDRHNGNRQEVSIIGQESVADTWRLCKMNLAIRGIAHNLGDTNASTFTQDLHPDKKVDFIMANPPFNLKNWRGEDELTDDPRFKGFPTPPVANANYAWILHMLSKLDVTNGIAGFLLANGALNADGVEYQIRKELLERDKIEAIIVLPRDMFYTTDISVTLWIMNNNKKARTLNGRQLRDRTNEVLFVDLRSWDENIEEYVIDKGKKKKKIVLTDTQIAEVKKVYNNWQSTDRTLYSDVPEFCKSATLEDIRTKNYSLAPSKYIEFIDHDLDIDYEKEMTRIQLEMREIMKAEKKSQAMLEEAFRGIGYGID